MRELAGDIWDFLGRAVVVITTNGSLTRDGRAVLGRGCARQALRYVPDLPVLLGRLMAQTGNHVQVVDNSGLVSFPVEESAWSLPEMRLIARSAAELRALADSRGWNEIVLPRPGCGGGGLSWRDVRPLLADCLDDRFTIIERPDVPAERAGSAYK